jgi:hypothetical protein
MPQISAILHLTADNHEPPERGVEPKVRRGFAIRDYARKIARFYCRFRGGFFPRGASAWDGKDG